MTNKKIAYLYLLITFFAWGSLYVVSKFVLGKIPPITILLLRYLIAGTVLLFIIAQKNNRPKIERHDFKYIFLIGFVGYFLSVGSQLLGIKFSNASVASLINSMNPVTITIFAAILLNEKLTAKKIVCVALAIIGVYSIIGGLNGDGQILGIIFSIISVVLWSLVSVIVRRITQKYGAFIITTYSLIVAAICIIPFSVCELIVTPNVQFNFSVIASLLYMGVICTALAYVLWNESLSVLEAGTCSLFYPVQPMVSVLLGCIFLGENITLNFVFGALLIICGVLLNISKKNALCRRQSL